jgi:iron complex outermembrane receptor protein
MPIHASGPRCRASALALAIAATGGIALPASAQSERAGGLEEITVTAQRRVESLQDTPIAITNARDTT